MKPIRFGEQARRLLLVLAASDEDNAERLSAAEWEATFAVMGLQVAFLGGLPAVVAEECYATMAEVARRTGMPLRIVGPDDSPGGTH